MGGTMKPCSLLISFAVILFKSSNANSERDIFDVFPWKVDPDFNRNLTELITSKGYPVQEYTAQTPDGYLLTVLRIPSGIKKMFNVKQEKKVVFLQHALLSSACDWVLNFPNQSLAFILADHGYDVWLGNIRGNTYARRNIYYPPETSKFWNFSFDEMAEYDMPSMIDLVLNITGRKNLTYIGHSQGTTIAFALLSQKPEYNEKINMLIGLGPVATVGHITSPIRYLTPFTADVDFLFSILGVNELLPSNIIMKYLSEIVCDTKLKFICENAIFLFCGTDYSQLNATRLGVYVSHTPAGSSTKNVIHYAQMVNSKKFQKYDYGPKGNMLEYNQTSAPEYHLENITTKAALIWSENDKLADPTDVHILEKKLKNLVSSTSVKLKKFNHLDFVWAVDANILVYENVLSLLKNYS